MKFVICSFIHLDCFCLCSYDIIPWLSYQICVATISLRKNIQMVCEKSSHLEHALKHNAGFDKTVIESYFQHCID